MPTPTNPTPDIVARLFDAHRDQAMESPVDWLDYDVFYDAASEITHLAALLDGVLADDPQAIRDAAAWLVENRPAVDGGDTVDEGEG